MRVLALDVDGVLLDPQRGGSGPWTVEMERAFGITRPQIQRALFERSFDDMLIGRRSIDDGVAEALADLGGDVAVDDFLEVWFDTDFVVIDDTVALANRATAAGCAVVLATNQEHRRAAFVRERLGRVMRIDDVCYSADLGVTKHDAGFFELASARLGIESARRFEVVFVDDVEHNVAQARLAGWLGVHAPPGMPAATWIAQVDRLLDRC